LTDIVVTLAIKNKSHLQHKILAAQEDELVWWDMKREPSNFNEEDKVFIVCDGKITGFFTIAYIRHHFPYAVPYAAEKIGYLHEAYYKIPIDDEIVIRIFFDNWIPINPIKMKGFQGFRYRDFQWREPN